MRINFDRTSGLVPAIVQDVVSQRVLMLGYMNQEALNQTINSGKVTFFSRSKERLWTKGESSGNYLFFEGVSSDCDGDALLLKARAGGPVCHTGSKSCFVADQPSGYQFLDALTQIVAESHLHPRADSYLSDLFSTGLNRIAQKVGEEAVELVLAAKDGDKKCVESEAADLIFHLLVLLRVCDVALPDVIGELERRRVCTAGQ